MTSTPVALSLTGAQHQRIRDHLFPADGKEAVALLLCGRHAGEERHRLLVHEVVPVPYSRCTVRERDRVTWPTDLLDPLLARATKDGFAIVKIHGHPTGFPRFSETDDASDKELFPSIYVWTDRVEPHGSAVMLPDGTVFGRTVSARGEFSPWARVSMVGDELTFWSQVSDDMNKLPMHAERIAQAFGKRTLQLLQKLRVAVIGCSGTGSLVIEQLARNCVGELVLLDPERIEDRNLNRIVNATKQHVGQLKVDVLKAAVERMGLGTRVTALATDLFFGTSIRAVAECDVIFGCVDAIEGRHLLNRIATYYTLPYFDVGVKLGVDSAGAITRIEACSNYLQPGKSTLLSRGMYTPNQLAAAFMKRRDPLEYERRRREGYIDGVAEERPAVMSVNMLAASFGVNDFLARIHSYRDVPNAFFDRQLMSLFLGVYDAEALPQPDVALARHVGGGFAQPLLGMPEFDEGLHEAAT